MSHALEVYGALVRASVRAQMRYKLSALFSGFGYFVVFWSEFAAIWILFGHFGSLGGWSLAEVAVCYGIAHLSYSLAELLIRGFEFLAYLTRSGEYDRLLLRPVSTVIQLAGHEFALHRFGRVVQALIVLVAGVAGLGRPIGIGGGLHLVWAVAGGVALFSALYVFQGSVGMKTLQNIEAFNILTNGGPEMAQFPMSIYPRGLRLVFTFLIPLAAVVYYPALTVLAHPDPAPPWVGWVSPLGGWLLLAVAFGVFRLVERSYISTGS